MNYIVRRIDRVGFNGDVAAFTYPGNAREYARHLSEQNPNARIEVSATPFWPPAENRSLWCVYVKGDSVKGRV